MPLEVIGAGLGRTGTLSLKTALERLGFDRCYHMVEVLAHPGHADVWDAAARGEAVDWEALFQGYRATVDWPGCSFYKEFMALYPDAKVILTVRDPARWYDSARETIYRARELMPAWVLPLMPRVRASQRMIQRLIWDGFFGGRFADREAAIAAYERHNAEVRATVPPEKLLVFEVREGWGPLCAFLGVPEPQEPFPRLNDAGEFRTRLARVTRVTRFARVAALTAAAVAGLLLAAVVYRLAR